ncbi:Centromere protein Mis12 [Metarhizium album ARSEF 1941]|uniref:Centromere protein Mis12 n=1 Tax=Metarhizium album (strain ARSEF 1941) TaxID=1081103 RepID=A0A0B2WUB4_METAS|nr:Centromere protein Mis12 [Metarhizium album ARSEF 1941]KHN97653.1 Centromere protein Mis12 [Metarhizium album ARSEF 1941]
MAANGSDYELLTEHFGYPPAALLDDIINTVNVLADRALDSVERLLLTIPPQNLGFKAPKPKPKPKPAAAADADADAAQTALDAARLEIENGTHQLETLLNAAIDKNFDIFELYTMQNILTVKPQDQPFMRLSHYDGLDLSNDPDRPTVESITSLRRRLHASQKLHIALEAERARNDALLRHLKAAVGLSAKDDAVEREDGAAGKPANQLAFLREKATLEQGGTNKPITTTAEFALSQLEPLRSLSESLRSLLPGLAAQAAGGQDTEGPGKSWRRQRAEYIEGASRKYLERTGGLELGPQGEVRDGEWQGGGPSLSRGEVEGLENVASLLAGEGGQGAET